MKLQAKIINHEKGGYERVVLCQYKDADNNKVYISEVELNGIEMFRVLLDEGYSKTEYFYPVNKFIITELSIYEE